MKAIALGVLFVATATVMAAPQLSLVYSVETESRYATVDTGHMHDDGITPYPTYNGATNDSGSVGLYTYGDQVIVAAKGWWGDGAMLTWTGTEVSGGAPTSWTREQPALFYNTTTTPWSALYTAATADAIMDSSGTLIMPGMLRSSSPTSFRLGWLDPSTGWQYQDITTAYSVYGNANATSTVNVAQLGSGNLGVIYRCNTGDTGMKYMELTKSGSSYTVAVADSEIINNRDDYGYDFLVDPDNGRLRLFTPYGTTGTNTGMSVVKADGTFQTFQYPGLSNTAGQLNAVAGDDGRYYVAGMNSAGQITLVDFEYDEATNNLAAGTTAGQYTIGGGNSDPNWATNPQVQYDEKTGLVLVAWLEGVNNGSTGFTDTSLGYAPGANGCNLYAKVGRRDAETGNLIFSDSILIDNNAARLTDILNTIWNARLEDNLEVKIVENEGAYSSVYVVYNEFTDAMNIDPKTGLPDPTHPITAQGFRAEEAQQIIKFTLLPGVRGDTDFDDDVDFTDLGNLISNYNMAGQWAQGDFDGNDTVSFSDLGDLIANYGLVGTPTPEPATMSLLALAGLGLIRRRR